jgi:mgtE-like transporter
MNKKKVFLETFPVLLLCALGGSLSGYILGHMADIIKIIPGLIALVPAVIGMRGNITSAMGARLGSAVHLGLIEDNIASDIAKENLKSSLFLSLFVSLLLPLFYMITSFVIGFKISIKIVLSLSMISIATGLISGILLSSLAFFIIIMSVRWGIDPDNITGPLLTTLGDVITLTILFSFSILIGGLLW